MKLILNERESFIGNVLAILLTGMVLALAACGEKPQPPPLQPVPPKLLQQERGALENAKGVELSEAKSTEDLKRETEKQTQ